MSTGLSLEACLLILKIVTTKWCHQCSSRKSLNDFYWFTSKNSLGSECIDCSKRRSHRDHQANRDSRNAYQVDRRAHFTAYQKAIKNQQSRLQMWKIKVQVLTHYSNGNPQCACCDEDSIYFLALDHINGGGNKHRKTLKKEGIQFYRHLIHEGLPAGYQVLCHNCNIARGHFGFCPHQGQRKGQQLLLL